MNTQILPCCDERLEQLLGNLLGDDEIVAFEEHLEQCPHCKERLTALSASSNFWIDAQTFLSSAEQLPEPHQSTLSYDFDLNEALSSDDGESNRRNASDIPLQPTDDPDMLGRFGGYEVCGVIGRGGMGVVLKGWDRSLDRFVAIKVLSPTFAHQPAARLRFAREAKAAAAVVHDNVTPIYGVDHCNDLPYLVMPYIKGESLQKRIDRESPLSVEAMLEISVQIARGLQAAHDQGVIHRDIKPANILLPQSVSRVLITDFGLARAANDATLTHSGIIAGTPAYMSPEQAIGNSVDSSSDLFSLGSVMYAMACGDPPFRAESSYGVLRRIIDEPHPPLQLLRPDLPHWFYSIVDRLLAKKASQRFASAAELANHLEHCLAHLRQPALNPLPKLQSGQRYWLRIAITMSVIVAVSLFAYWDKVGKQPKREASLPVLSDRLNETTWADVDEELEELEQQLKQIEMELDP
jgi:eukaryotic-like serine/threonine-protein kinase